MSAPSPAFSGMRADLRGTVGLPNGRGRLTPGVVASPMSFPRARRPTSSGHDEGGPMKVGTEQGWQAARKELLAAERELEQHARRAEDQRRALPWVPLEKE